MAATWDEELLGRIGGAARRRGGAQGRRRRPRPDDQPAPLAAGRPALRVLLRGPAAVRPAGHRLRAGRAGAAASAPAPSTTSPTTPRPTASPSTTGSTSGRCASSTWRRSRPSSPTPTRGWSWPPTTAVNGAPMTENDLLAEPLKGEWGFDGVVVSDWGATYNGEPAARAALDLTMPGPDAEWREPLVEAVRDGRRARGRDRREGPPDPAAGRPRRRPRRRRAGGGEAGRGPDRGRRTAGPRGRGRGRGPAAQRRAPAAAGRHPAPGRRDRPRGQGRPRAGRRVGERAAAVRGHARSPGSRAALDGPRRGRHRRGRDAVGLAARRPGRRAVRDRTSGSTVVLRWLDADGATVAEQPAGTATIIRLLDDVPGGCRGAGGRTPASSRTRTATGGSASSASAAACSRSTATTVLEETEEPEVFDIHQVFALAAAARRRTVPLRRRPAGRRPHAVPLARRRASSSGSASSWAPPIAVGRRGARARRRAGAHAATSRSSSSAPSRTWRARASTGPRSRCPAGRTSWCARWRRPTRARSSSSTPASPVELPWRDEVSAVLVSWFPGMEFGNALADVLLGEVEPGGRLPTTWPAAMADAPVLEVTPDRRPARVHRGPRHRAPRLPGAAGTEPAYWFGHGLGYTTWEYESIEAAPTGDGLTATGAGAQHRGPARQAGRAGLRRRARTRPSSGRPAGWPASRSSPPSRARASRCRSRSPPARCGTGRSGAAGPSSPAR